jgi:putative glutathione S-transferase
MGLLIDGVWHDQWYDTSKSGGRFVRSESQFRNWVTPDGSPGPSGEGGFPAEAGRYHLYVSLACPWASRAVIVRKLKRLDGAIGLSVVDPYMGEQGWEFSDAPGAIPDTVNGKRFMHELYTLAQPDYTGRVTVPVLWDTQRNTIVSNESAEIIRMLNSGFPGIGDDGVDLYPEPLRPAIAEINDFVYPHINNGVYRCGFATTQEAYEEAFYQLFAALDRLEDRLAQRRYLVGDQATEADWRLFTTLVRFDAVYVGHFKTNQRRIADFPNLSGYLRELYQWPGIAGTVDFDHIKQHYYRSHKTINPTGIVPLGPKLDLDRPHGRDALKAAAE